MCNKCLAALPGLMVVLLASSAFGQWTTQSFSLKAGWNAVFVEIQPEPSECDKAFEGMAVESVWTWNKRFSTVQYVQDPSTLFPGQPDWLFYVPPASTNRPLVSLFALRPRQAYLIKLASNAGPTVWTVKGRPAVRKLEWLSDSMNLLGLPVDPAAPGTFRDYLAASPAHSGSAIFRLDISGLWLAANPNLEKPNAGEAYWIQSKGPSDYSGPLEVTLEQGRMLEFGSVLVEQTIRIKNSSTSSRTVILSEASSASPPAGTNFPALAGPVPLSYWSMNSPNDAGFLPLPAQLAKTIPSGGEWPLRLAVRRSDMTPFTPPAGITDVLYQSLLLVTDGAGTRVIIPVSAKGLKSYPVAGRGASHTPIHLDPASPPDPRAGLWVGHAVIAQVNQPANLSNPTNPLPTASELQFRLILHVDDGGQARLLQQALLMWTNGVSRTNAAGYTEMVQPGHYVLISDDSLISRFGGAALRDGQPIARRFSSAAFSFRTPLPLNQEAGGAFGADGSRLSGSFVLDYDDPVNPFKHKYHPDHNNLDERFTQRLGEGNESFTVRRELTLEFTAADPDHLALAGWGDNQLGGVYREVLSGLHKNPLYVRGTFRLNRVCRVGELNQGL